MRASCSKVLLKLEEEFKLLELLVIDDTCINIVRVVSGPLEEGLAFVGHTTEVESASDTGDRMSWLSGDDLISKSVLHIRDLIDSQIPLGPISIHNVDN